MTPKEKATEIKQNYGKMAKEFCLGEIDNCPIIVYNESDQLIENKSRQYWQEVLKELEPPSQRNGN
jgi:hypothetical protein